MNNPNDGMGFQATFTTQQQWQHLRPQIIKALNPQFDPLQNYNSGQPPQQLQRYPMSSGGQDHFIPSTTNNFSMNNVQLARELTAMQQLRAQTGNAALNNHHRQQQQNQIMKFKNHRMQCRLEIVQCLYRRSMQEQQRPLPPSLTTMDIEYLGDDMMRLNIPDWNKTGFIHTHWASFLPSLYAYAVYRIKVFKFSPRKSTFNETQQGARVTQNAMQFLSKLNGKQSNVLLGFRCAKCMNHHTYIPGCTSFVDLSASSNFEDSLKDVLFCRLKHLAQRCPYISEMERAQLKTYMDNPMTSTMEDVLRSFLTEWMECVIAAHFNDIAEKFLAGLAKKNLANSNQASLGNAPQSPYPNSNAFAGRYGARLSSNEPTEPCFAFDDMGDAIATVSQLISTDGLSFHDIATNIEGYEDTSVFAELFSQIFYLRLRQNFESKGEEATIGCSSCNTACKLGSIFSNDPDMETESTNVSKFVCNHARECQSTSAVLKRHFLLRVPQHDDDFWKAFLKRWKRQFLELLQCQQGEESLPATPPTCDVFFSMTLEDRKNEIYSEIPFHCIQTPQRAKNQLNESTYMHSNYIVVENEDLRDCDGNRWFRGLISKWRSMYAKVSDEQQAMVVKAISKYISKFGYTFVTVDGDGKPARLSNQLEIKFIEDGLKNGFHYLLRPVSSPGGNRCFDVEVAPRVGKIFGGVCWNIGAEASPVLSKEELLKLHVEFGRHADATPKMLTRFILENLRGESLGDKDPMVVETKKTAGQATRTSLNTKNAISEANTKKTLSHGQTKPSSLSRANGKTDAVSASKLPPNKIAQNRAKEAGALRTSSESVSSNSFCLEAGMNGKQSLTSPLMPTAKTPQTSAAKRSIPSNSHAEVPDRAIGLFKPTDSSATSSAQNISTTAFPRSHEQRAARASRAVIKSGPSQARVHSQALIKTGAAGPGNQTYGIGKNTHTETSQHSFQPDGRFSVASDAKRTAESSTTRAPFSDSRHLGTETSRNSTCKTISPPERVVASRTSPTQNGALVTPSVALAPGNQGMATSKYFSTTSTDVATAQQHEESNSKRKATARRTGSRECPVEVHDDDDEMMAKDLDVSRPVAKGHNSSPSSSKKARLDTSLGSSNTLTDESVGIAAAELKAHSAINQYQKMYVGDSV